MKRPHAVLCVYSAVIPFLAAGFRPGLFNGWFPAWSRVISALMSKITSPVPFPLAELAAYAAIIAFPAYWAASFIRRRDFRRAGRVTLVWASSVAAAFVWFWGLNYFCAPPSARMGLSPAPVTVETLISTAVYYRDGLNAAYTPYASDFRELSRAIAGGFNSLSERYGFISPNPAPPKRLTFGTVQSYLGISGVYLPWTGEACVVGDTPPPHLPATMAHEMAHRQGVGHEDEASFIGILACLESEHPFTRYSGMFYAFIHLSNAVLRNDRDAYAELWKDLDRRVIEDRIAMSLHYAKYEGPVSDAGRAVNDTYLKAMQQPEGARRYGLVVDLLIAHRAAAG